MYMRLVQLIFTVCVYCSTGSLPLLPDKKVLCTVNDTVPNLCPTATAGIVNVSPGEAVIVYSVILQSGMDMLVHKYTHVGLEDMSESCCVDWRK